jgi:serine/threonine-protein kinase
VKVLDFGLAKAMDSSPAASSPAHSPTLSVLATQAGLIMGTAAYMSPEQAKGLATDRRSDVFSFGVVLYELLTARQPFSGETGAEIMAAVMLREADLTVLPAGINPRIRELIARCIEKNPKKRWQAMGDLRLELESLIAAPHQTTTSNAGQTVPVASPLWKRAIPIAAAVLVTAIVSIVTTRWLTPPPPSRAAFRFTIPPSPSINQSFQSLAWSPDGSRLVYLTQSVQGERRLMLRTMGDLEARPIAGASGQVSSPAFSPDGQFVAFFSATEGVLKKIAINGGAAVTLCKMTVPYSGPAWHPSGIVFAQTNGVMRVSADGGEPELIVKIGDGERIAAPQLIDDRGTLLFSYTTDALLSAGWDKGQVIVQSATAHDRSSPPAATRAICRPVTSSTCRGRRSWACIRCGDPSRTRKPGPGRRGDRARGEPAVRRALRGVDVRSAGLRRGCSGRGGGKTHARPRRHERQGTAARGAAERLSASARVARWQARRRRHRRWEGSGHLDLRSVGRQRPPAVDV